MSDFLPVLLGSDANVYGMARSFYQQYGVRSVAICKGALVATSNTNLVKIAVLEPDLENDETFVKTLTDYAKAHADKPLVLVSCADGYTVLIGRHRDALKPYYHFACPELQTVLDLDIKENFYRACEAHGLSYPKTATCNAQNYKNIELPFAFPVIIKASNSPAYWNCTFPHKKKVFLANNREEFDAITAAIYGSSYQDELILQEYIPGDDNCMRVLNAYCGLDHKVKLMALGRPLLEEQTPEGIGNYAAILSDPEYNDAALLEKLKNFLEDMQWEGFANMDINELYDWLMNVDQFLSDKQKKIAAEILKEIRTRLKFLLDVGLDYLALNRSSVSLSGGESQRIRLATQIGSQLVNVLYILDEPSIGLHQRDNLRLIRSLKELRDMGNSVIVVEHDKDMMLAADYVIDMGPKAGRLGGEVVFSGTPSEMLQTETMTSQYLNGEMKIEVPAKRRKGNGKSIWLKGAKGNNLKNVDVEFPLGKLICVTGVSGSGKSTLINETLQPILSQKFYRSLQDPLEYDSIEGLENIDKVVDVDQSPIGRTPRSNPATYTGVFSDIRNLFVSLPEAKIRGYKPGRFSFNVSGGRCEACTGNGYKTIEMNFLPDVYVPCEVCHGKRYNRETLEVRFKGKSIADVLDMTINRAVEFFENVPQILNKIKVLQDVGLGYIKLGQSSTTLSGGESQRVKLATELSKRDTGKTLYILDEPTTGLHFEDIRVLMGVLNKLVDKGNTVIVIEHNLDVIKMADYIIDMGPEGGKGGGVLLSYGTPEEVAKSQKGYTPKFLREELGL